MCELCTETGGELLWQDAKLRVVLVNEVDYPGFCRVIWQSHVREMSDLTTDEQHYLLDTVVAVERAVRVATQADKVNLASLGNVTPHVHWHVIPRWVDDRHFPQPIWAAPQRASSHAPIPDWKHGLLAALRTFLPVC